VDGCSAWALPGEAGEAILKYSFIYHLTGVDKMKISKLKTLASAGLLACVAALSSPAHAANDAMLDLLKALHANGTIDQATYEVLVNSSKADEEQNEHTTKKVVAAKVEEATKDTVKINTKEKLAFESQDGNFKWDVFGRIMVDYQGIDDDQTEQVDGFELRRLRLGLGGTLWKVWNFKFQPDFAKGTVTMKDAWIGYKGFANTQIKLGNHHVPFGQDLLNSSKYMMFIERSTLMALQEGLADRRIGLSAAHHGDSWHVRYGLFGKGANGAADDLYTAAVRANWLPYHEKTKAVNLGVSYLHGFHGDATGKTLSLKSHPEIHLASDLVKTPAIAADNYDMYAVEAAGVYGPFTALAEYNRADINVQNAPSVTMDGWYIQGSWFLTGESRHLSNKDAMFHSIKPHSVVGKGGYGAWEVAARYSSVDLSDGAVDGGEEDNFTIGVNWYPTKTTRMMLDYVKVLDVNYQNIAATHHNDEPGAIYLRSQVYW